MRNSKVASILKSEDLRKIIYDQSLNPLNTRKNIAKEYNISEYTLRKILKIIEDDQIKFNNRNENLQDQYDNLKKKFVKLASEYLGYWQSDPIICDDIINTFKTEVILSDHDINEIVKKFK